MNNIVWARESAEPIGVRKSWRCSTNNVIFKNNSFIGKKPSKKEFKGYAYDVKTISDISKVRNCKSSSNIIGLDESDVIYKDTSEVAFSNFMLSAGESIIDTGNCDLVFPLVADFDGSVRSQGFGTEGVAVVDPGVLEMSPKAMRTEK